MAAGSLVYSFSTQTVEPPTGTQLRLDAGPPYSGLSKMWARFTTTDTLDAYYVLRDIPAGARCFIQDKNDHARFVAFITMGLPIDRTDYMEYPISYVEHAGLALSNQDVMLVLASPSITVALATRVLKATITAADTRIVLDGAPVSPDLLAMIDDETMLIQRIVVTTPGYFVCQVLRGVDGSAAARHAARSTCYLAQRRDGRPRVQSLYQRL